MAKRRRSGKTPAKPARKPARQFIDRVTGKRVSAKTYQRRKGTGRFVDLRRSRAAKKAAKTRALNKREATRDEIQRLAEVLRKRRRVSKAKARDLAKQVVAKRQREAKRATTARKKEEQRVRRLPLRTFEYEAKLPYKSRRDGAQVLVNLRMRFRGKVEPADAEVREVMYNALRVEGKPPTGWTFHAIDWRNAQANRSINAAPPRAGDSDDLTAFQAIVGFLGRDALVIGEVE